MQYDALFGSPRTFSRSTIEDADGLKTSVATSATQQVYSGVALNGAEAAALAAKTCPARTLSFTSAANPGTYKLLPIVITGTYGGVAVTESLTPTLVNGGETIRGTQPFEGAITITVPGQNDAGGAWTFGVQDICAPDGKGIVFRWFKALANGNLLVQFDDGRKDLMTCVSQVREDVLAKRIMTTDGVLTSTVGVTVYE